MKLELNPRPCHDYLLQRTEINDKPVPNIALRHSLVGLIHLLNGNDLDICGDFVPAAVIQHLLCFGQSADERSSDAPSTQH